MNARILLLLASCTLLPACASIVQGSSQTVNIDTTPRIQGTCVLKNERGQWTLSTIPGSVNIKRSKTDLMVTCQNAEYRGSITNVSDGESWAAGNVLAGGLIGAGVDAGTGALFSYDDMINVPVTPIVSDSALPMGVAPNVMLLTQTPPAPVAPPLACATGSTIATRGAYTYAKR